MTMINEINFDEENEEIMSDNEQTLRHAALAMAIESNCGQTYDENGNVIFSDTKFVNAAVKFYGFLKEITNENVQANRN
jgi:hypothetical protein